MPDSFSHLLAQSVALERLEGIRQLSGDSGPNPLYTTVGIATVVVLLIVLVIINQKQRKGKTKPSEEIFADYANKRGLTERESRLLWAIAGQARLKYAESVFSLPTAYDRGEIKFTQDHLAEHGSPETQRLQVELSFLREKLGFHQKSRAHLSVQADPKGLNSRQIPTGKKLYIRHHRSTNTADLEAVIVKTDADELIIQFNQQVEVAFGQPWRCRYYSGASLWEFDTVVISSSGPVVSLQHSDQIRLINRRKFLRVPVKRAALVTPFPFLKRSDRVGIWPRKKNELSDETMPTPVDLLQSPAFTPATVTELGGSGLRINADIDVRVNDRVLICFRLNADESVSPETPDPRGSVGKVIQSVAVVRHVRSLQDNRLSIALELTGIDDDEVDELIRATNEASIEEKNRNNQPQTPAAALTAS